MAQPPRLHVEVQRTQLGRVRGLGAAKAGTGHWWAERITAIALVPLTLWFVISVIGHLGATQAVMVAWLGHPMNATLMICLVLATFHHLQLGLQVVIDDYIHAEPTRFATVLAIKGLSAFLALACVVSVLKLTFFRGA